MAYDGKKLTRLEHLQMLAERIVRDYATMQYVTDAIVAAEAREHNYEMAEAEESGDYAKRYYLKDTLTGEQAGVMIDIPKDMVVESGEVVDINADNVDNYPDFGDNEYGEYIHLVLANADESDLYINVAKLLNIYTADNAEDAMVLIKIEDYKVSADLSDKVKDILDKADTYELEPATTEVLGGIIVGDSLNVEEDGTLSVNVASEEEVTEMLDEIFEGEVQYEDGDEGGDTEPGDEQP